jgi:serine/threonine protein kinase
MIEQKENLKYFKAFGVDLSALKDKAPYKLILRCLNPNPQLRPSIEELLAHPFIKDG